MISIDIDSIKRSLEVLKSKKAMLEETAVKGYRSKILGMYWELLMVSPQFSGDFVGNWDIEVSQGLGKLAAKTKKASLGAATTAVAYKQVAGKSSFTSHPSERYTAPHKAGDQDGGFASSLARGRSRMKYVTYYGQPVSFVNSTQLEIDSPIIIGPDGIQKLRDGVVIGAWESISSYLQARYGLAKGVEV